MLASAQLGARHRDHQGMGAWGDIGMQIGEACSALTHRGRCPVGTVNGLREEQRVGLQARKGSLRPVPGDSEHLQQPNEGKR